MMARLKDKVAIVTGGGRGVGRAIALAFASEGASVVLAARSVDEIKAVAEEIAARKGRAMPIATDVSIEGQVKQMVAKTIQEYGQIDILVNNSGILGPVSFISDMPLDAWNETLAVNLTGAMLCSREVLKHMIPRRMGAIINIGSEGGRGGDGRSARPGRGVYCCSKMAMIGLGETMAVEVGKYGIRVNTISPAGVTGVRTITMIQKKAKSLGISYDDLMARMLETYSLGRMTEETEVASVALFLASPESSAITGQVIPVNCGHHIPE